MSPDAGTEDNGISTEPISLLLFPGLLPLTVSMMNWRNPSSREKMLIIYLYNIEYESYPNLISHSKCGTVHSWFMPCPSLGPKRFWTVQIVLDRHKSFWLGPNHFGQVQIILVRFKLDFYGLILTIWTFKLRSEQKKWQLLCY